MSGWIPEGATTSKSNATTKITNTIFILQVIIQYSEDKLQKSVYILTQMSKDYNLKISTDKTKIMAFKGKHLVRSKIEIDGSILVQVKQFNYLGCKLSLDSEPDIKKKK
jgi:hypothetical protein